MDIQMERAADTRSHSSSVTTWVWRLVLYSAQALCGAGDHITPVALESSSGFLAFQSDICCFYRDRVIIVGNSEIEEKQTTHNPAGWKSSPLNMRDIAR